MRFGAVRDLIAHPRREDEDSAIIQFGMQFAFEAQEDVSLAAPVIRQVAGGVIHHAHPDGVKLLRAPQGNPRFTIVFHCFDLRPIRRAKGDVLDVHKNPFQ